MNAAGPRPGDVVHLAYLWHREALQGRVEGAKDRPCVVLLVSEKTIPDAKVVSVLPLPITHSPPRRPGDALELPRPTKRRLGPDDAPSWVVTTERCRFRWPGYDLRRTPDGRERYGILSRVQVRALLAVVAENQRRGKFETVERDD